MHRWHQSHCGISIDLVQHGSLTHMDGMQLSVQQSANCIDAINPLSCTHIIPSAARLKCAPIITGINIKVNLKTTRQIWGIWKLGPAYSPETPNLGKNGWCFVPCDLEIWWMTLENNRASLLCCFKLCATFHSHRWNQTGVPVRKRPIWVKFDNFFEPCDLEIWQMILKNNRAPLLCYFKLCVSFRSHWWINTAVTVRKHPFCVKFDNF